jgi:hypothetical protein
MRICAAQQFVRSTICLRLPIQLRNFITYIIVHKTPKNCYDL